MADLEHAPTEELARPLEERVEKLAAVGAGAMCQVFRGRRREDGVIVALKCLSPELATVESQQERFQREGRNAARLRHPNIVTVYEVGLLQGQPTIVMEFLDGMTLRQRAAAGLSLERSLAVMIEVLDALAYAHAMGITHRDLKPANIMVLPTGVAKVADWGLARAMTDETGLTETGFVLGTPLYMAPEQIASHRVGPAADLYAVGVMLYEMTTKKLPFTGEVLDILRSKLNFPAPLLSSAVRNVPPPLTALIDELLARDPSARPQQATEISLRLKEIRAGMAKHSAAIAAVPTVDSKEADETIDYERETEEDLSRSLPSPAARAPSATASRPSRRATATTGPQAVVPAEGSAAGVSPRPVSARQYPGRWFVLGLVIGLLAASSYFRGSGGTHAAAPPDSHGTGVVKTVDLANIKTLALTFAAPCRHGRIELTFADLDGTPTHHRPIAKDIALAARTAGTAVSRLSVPVDAPIVEPLLVKVGYAGAAEKAQRFYVDPTAILDELLKPLSKLSPTNLTRLLDETAKINAQLQSWREDKKDPAMRRRESARMLREVCEQWSLDGAACAQLSKALATVLSHPVLPGSPLARRLLPLRHVERLLNAAACPMPPWELVINAALGIRHGEDQPPADRPGWQALYRGSFARRVSEGKRTKELWLWLVSPRKLRQFQNPSSVLTWSPIKEALGDADFIETATEVFPTPQHLRSSGTLFFELSAEDIGEWPPRQAELVFSTRLFIHDVNFTMQLNDGPTVVVMNTSNFDLTVEQSFSVAQETWTSVPIAPRLLQRPGVNCLKVDVRHYGGPEPVTPLAISAVTLWVR